MLPAAADAADGRRCRDIFRLPDMPLSSLRHQYAYYFDAAVVVRLSDIFLSPLLLRCGRPRHLLRCYRRFLPAADCLTI